MPVRTAAVIHGLGPGEFATPLDNTRSPLWITVAAADPAQRRVRPSPAEVVVVAGSQSSGAPPNGAGTAKGRAIVADWRQAVEARARRARTDLATMYSDPRGEPHRQAALAELDVVDHVLAGADGAKRSLASWWSGWHIERAWRALHEAEVNVAVASNDLAARLPGLRERVGAHLHSDDRRRAALDQLSPSTPPSPADRAVVLDALRGAFDASDDAHWSARSLRNKLVALAAVLAVLNTVVGVVCVLRPGLVPLCFPPTDGASRVLVCPAGVGQPDAADLWLVQLLGIFGATIGAGVLLVRRRPSLSPYVLSGYQALIKILLGSAMAVVGVLGLGAGLAHGLANVGSPAALLLWAVLLGYSQEFGTRLLDNYADRVISQARPLTDSPGHSR